MSLLVRKYDPATGRDSVGSMDRQDIRRSDCDLTISPFLTARRQLQAHKAILNHQQNIGRASFSFADHSMTILPNTYKIAPFTHFDTLPATLRAWTSMMCSPLGVAGIAFVCMEAGWYNLKGGITLEISVPAVPATRITKAEASLIFSPKDNPHFAWFWQDTQYADVQVIAGPPAVPVMNYLCGWSHTFAEKLWMDCGDMVWLVHKYTGLGQIEFVENYEGRLAIQRTGEPFMIEECCSNV